MAIVKTRVRRVRVDEKKVFVHDAYEQFLISRNASCSEASIRIYKEKRKPIEEGFLRYDVKIMEEINPQVIRQIIADYRESHSDNGAWKLYTYIRTFLRWYWAEYSFNDCPIDKVKVKKPSMKPKHGITRDEIDRMLKVIK